MSRSAYWRFAKTPDGLFAEKGARSFVLEWPVIRRFLEREVDPGITEDGPDGGAIYFGGSYLGVKVPRQKRLVFPRPFLEDIAREAGEF